MNAKRPTTSPNAGLIAVLEWFTQQELFDAEITIRGDNLLAIQQMFGAWKINKGIYAPLAYKARGLRAQFTNMRGEWISRELNDVADRLSKEAVEASRCEVTITACVNPPQGRQNAFSCTSLPPAVPETCSLYQAGSYEALNGNLRKRYVA